MPNGTALPYTITPSRYARNKLVIRPTPDGTGLKTRAACLAECKAVNGKWVGRSGGYHVSKRGAKTFEKLFAEGYDASFLTGELLPPPTAAMPSPTPAA